MVKTFPEAASADGIVHVHTNLSFDLRYFKSFKEVIEYAIKVSGKSNKDIAISLGIGESRLTMMLTQYEGKRHFPLAWLPDLIRVLGDPGKIVVHWLVNEFLLSPEERRQQAEDVLARYGNVFPMIAGALETIAASRKAP